MNTLNRTAKFVLVMGAALVVFTGCGTVAPTPSSQIGDIVGAGRVEVQFLGVGVTLTAHPQAGWRFDHWEGLNDFSTENPHTIGTTRLAYYVAVFVPEEESDSQT